METDTGRWCTTEMVNTDSPTWTVSTATPQDTLQGHPSDDTKTFWQHQRNHSDIPHTASLKVLLALMVRLERLR